MDNSGSDRPNFLADLHAAVKERGVKAVAEAAFISESTVRKFLRDPLNVRISTFSRLCRAVDMPHGDLHLVDRQTGRCITCQDGPEAHYPLLPESEAS